MNKKVLFLYLSGLLCAQESSVKGLIINDNDQTPIHGADVYLEKLAIGTISQVDGQFLLNNIPYGEIDIRVSMIGFKDVKRTLVLDKDSYDLGKVSMLRDTIKINEIFVDAHHTLQPHEFGSNINFSGEEYHQNLSK